MANDAPEPDALARTAQDPDLRLQLSRGVDYQRMRGLIESSLFGESAPTLRIGRFTVLERLGAGGMGVVYAAYDDVLDRKVAVKVLHGGADETSRARMLREARAMARVTHANIATVHEVGEHEGQVFLAMEFVRGRSLDRFIHARERPSWREVLEVFVRAGRGLAAAHAAQLVHRDFKPHNVMLGDDGTVKVLDFGLAAATASLPAESVEAAGSEPRQPAVPTTHETPAERSLTRTGAIVGTPAYMAPEQLRAEPASPASDQFAFCVSLWEGLYGERPFAGERLEQLAVSVLDGQVREPPAGSSVPAWVRTLVRRGLSSDPAARFDSMTALLDALSRDPAVVRRRWLGVGGVVAVAIAGSFGLAALQREPPVEPCQDVATALDDAWGPARREAVREGFVASGVSYAQDTWTRVESRLDAYAHGWIEAGTQACLAHAQGRQSDAIFDLRTVCLESRRASLRTVAQRLEQADAGVAERAATVVAGLPSLARCEDLQALTAAVPPPDDPARAQQVAGLREQLVRARVEEDAGRYDTAAELASETLGAADAIGYEPLRAEAALRLGSARLEQGAPEPTEAALTRAFLLALGSGHHEVAIEALSRRIFARAQLSAQPQRAQQDGPLARALLRLDPGDAHLRWLLANNLAVAHELLDEREQAVELYAEALSHARSRGDAGHLDASVVLANLAFVALGRADYVEAERRARDALALAEAELGPEHPHVPDYLYPLSLSLWAQGRHAQSRAQLERSIAIHEQRSGGVSPDISQDLYLLADIEGQRRAYERMQSLADRGLAIVERTLGPDALLRVRLLHAHGHARIGQGAVDEGLAANRSALALAIEQLGPTHVDVADSHLALARALRESGQLPEALAEVERAQELLGAAASADPSLVIAALRSRAELELGLERPEQARATAERALELTASSEVATAARMAPLRLVLGDARLRLGALVSAHQAHAGAVLGYEASYDEDHPELASARLALARSWWRCMEEQAGCEGRQDVDATRARVRRLAAKAAAAYVQLGPRFEPEAREAQAWRGVVGPG